MKKRVNAALWTVLLLAALPLRAAPPIRAFDPDGMTRIVASQKGKPFVLVVWSLDCVYCQASMKNLAQEKRRRKDFSVVTLSTDPVDDAQAVALMNRRLASVGLSSNAWAFGAAPPEQLRYAIDPAWYGEKPRSYWFNARGERVAYSGLITAEVIAKLAPQP